MNQEPTSFRPSLVHRAMRALGHTGLPKMEGLYQWLGLTPVTTQRSFECSFAGWRYRGRLDQSIDSKIYFFGAYAAQELQFLVTAAAVLHQSRKTVTFIDMGANVGQHSLFMCSHVERVVAFEPGHEAADQFAANIELNGISNIELIRMALGAETRDARLGSGFLGNNGSRSLTWTLDAARDTDVHVRPFDEVAIEHQCTADIVKMDVEGSEREVLAGMARTLSSNRPVLLFELVGATTKGGFASEGDLRSALYPDHVLFSLGARRDVCLTKFDWNVESGVCLPSEVLDGFREMPGMFVAA